MRLTFHEAKLRAEKLRAEIDKIRYAYHVLDKEIVSESAKSALTHELSELESQFPELIVPDSPTQRVAGEPLPGFKKITHKRPGLSLNDVFETTELEDWEKRTKNVLGKSYDGGYFCELKIDGLSIYLTYEKGLLKTAATRGNGKVGEDVTQNIRTIEAIPLKLSEPLSIEVRGEVFMTHAELEKINKERAKQNLPLYANPRNLAAGTLRQLDPKIVAGRKLEFAAWTVYDAKLKTHETEHKLAKELGFRVEDHSKLCKNLAEVEKYLSDWEDKRNKLPYQTDGAVININDTRTFDKLGIVGKAPRGSVAWKYSAEQGVTKVLDIRVNVGRTGALTPLAVMEPVKLAGTTVSRATLHNEDEIKRKDIRIGDTVIVQKAGDIIPEIVQSLPNLRTGKEKKFVMPKVCPVCGGPVVRPKGEAVARCAQTDCLAIEMQQIEHFVAAFDMDGLGEKIIAQLAGEGLISDAADLFKLEVGDIEPLERFAEKSAQNIVQTIQEHKKVTLDRFLVALGIRHIGAITATDIANYYGEFEKVQKATPEEIQEIDGVGPIAGQSLFDWLKSEKGQKLLDKLFEVGIKIAKPAKVGDKLAGKSFVVTGSLDTMSREEAQAKIRANGGKATSTVSAATNYLVVGDNPGSKLQKAEKLGVKVIDESEFIKLF
jgi:DNA ligase (NAD+)